MAEYKVVCSSQAWQDATVLELKAERRLFRSVYRYFQFRILGQAALSQ